MVIMETYYPSDRLNEVWQLIDQLHLSYLQLEESPEKLDYRIRLENCIKDFLFMVPHSQKFFYQETGDVLYQSASVKADFSGYKAATGWNAIQMYAGNLLSQPWRKEYRQIKTYCGFYKHQIEANLVGADIIFEQMGYKKFGNGILMLENPLCPDRVTSVSKDCLIAYVECQIIKAIWEEISPTFKIDWIEVLNFRKAHICSSQHAIRALTYKFHEKQYQIQQNSGTYGRCLHNNPAQYSQVSSHSQFAPTAYLYGSNCCPNNVPTYATVGYPVSIPVNSHYFSNGYVTQSFPIYDHSVPTGQLIDHRNNGSCSNGDIVKPKETAVKSETKLRTNSEQEQPHFEDWGYVYKNLESQGYSKDLGERGDVLNPSSSSLKPIKSTVLDETINNLSVADRPLKITEALAKYDQQVSIGAKKNSEKRQSLNSSYEKLSDFKKQNGENDKKRITTTKDNLNNNSTVDIINKSKAKNNLPKSKNDKWECQYCTYHNDMSKDICEICSKSRTNVESQMEIGGPQCSKCTLVNSKDTKSCRACNSSLKDSPTYI